MTLQEMLEPVVKAPGVLGSVIVSREDGLVVAGSFQGHVNGPAVAALAASLARRAGSLADALHQPEAAIIELVGGDGTLLAAPARAGLLLVVVTSPGANPVPAREELLRLADRVG